MALLPLTILPVAGIAAWTLAGAVQRANDKEHGFWLRLNALMALLMLPLAACALVPWTVRAPFVLSTDYALIELALAMLGVAMLRLHLPVRRGDRS